MKSLFLTIAGFTFKINFAPRVSKEMRSEVISHIDTEIENFFKDFILSSTPNKVDFTIELERKYPVVLSKKNKKFLYFYEELPRKLITYQHISFPQFIIVLRYALQKLLSQNKGIFFHGSASNFQGKAILFMGQNDAGKSTAVRLLSDTYPILADDSLIIKRENGIFCLYQTPFFEKGLFKKNPKKKYRVDNIFFLRKSKHFRMIRVEKKDDVLPYLSHQLLVEEAFTKNLLLNLFNFVEKFSGFYILSFARNKEKLKKLLEGFKCDKPSFSQQLQLKPGQPLQFAVLPIEHHPTQGPGQSAASKSPPSEPKKEPLT